MPKVLAPKKWSTKKLLQFVHEHATVTLIDSTTKDKYESFSAKNENDETLISSTETDKGETLIPTIQTHKDEL